MQSNRSLICEREAGFIVGETNPLEFTFVSSRELLLRIPLYLRNEMSMQYPKSSLKTPKYSTLTPKKVRDSSVNPKKVNACFIP